MLREGKLLDFTPPPSGADALPAPSDVYSMRVCRYGRMLYNPRDQYVGASLHRYGEFSQGEVDLFAEAVTPESWVVDAGANIGAHTVWFARRAKVVLAFEPQRHLFQILCANLACNSLLNVWAHPMGLGARPAQVRVPVLNQHVPNNFGGLWIEGHQTGEPVEVRPLDGFRLPRLDFLKIDVEGMELAVLEGAAATIGRHRPLIYAENDREDHDAGLRAALAAHDYECFEHRPSLYNSENFDANPENVFPEVVSINLACYPREALGDAEPPACA